MLAKASVKIKMLERDSVSKIEEREIENIKKKKN
jgi:hypothetical protein